MNIKIPPPEGQLVTCKKLSPSRVRPPHQTGGVGNIHEPWTGVDVTKITTARQTRALRHRVDTITLLRFRFVDDDGKRSGTQTIQRWMMRMITTEEEKTSDMSRTRREHRRNRR